MKNRLLGITDAYFAGQNGESRPANAGRLATIAHGVGRIVCGYHNEKNVALFAEQRARLDEAIEMAQGPNKKAIEILRDAEALPDEPHRLKAWSYTTQYIDGPNKGKRYRAWHTSIAHGTNNAPAGFGPGFERTQTIAPLGTLEIVDPMNAFPLRATVNNVVISVRHPIDRWGNPTGPPETRIDVNERTHDQRMATLSIDPKFMGGASIQLDGQGNVARLDLDMSNCSGNMPADLALRQPLVEPLLDSIHASVLATQQAYDSIV